VEIVSIGEAQQLDGQPENAFVVVHLIILTAIIYLLVMAASSGKEISE
jgi:hypothetical protein